MAAKLTGSSLERARHCPASHALSAVRQDSAAAARGRGVHGYLELVASGADPGEALAGVADEARAVCEKIDPAQVPHGEAEVAFAYHVRKGTARRTGAKGRAYGDEPGEVPGTVDLVMRDDTGRVVVVDWKTTRHTFDHQAARLQLEFYALCAAREAGDDRAGCAIAVITDDGAIAWDRWALDEEDLARVAALVRRVWEWVQQARAARAEHERTSAAPWVPDVSRGAWCTYCPAQIYCPAFRAILSLAAPELLDEVSEAAAAAAFERAQAFGVAEREIRGAVAAYHDAHGPITLPDGRFVGRDGRGSLRVLGRRAA